MGRGTGQGVVDAGTAVSKETPPNTLEKEENMAEIQKSKEKCTMKFTKENHYRI